MPSCPSCRYEIPPHELSARCPRCATQLELPDWVAIARVTNLAEVGYFADLLEGEEIAANVCQHNEYSALDGSWRTHFILQVPAASADVARQALKHQIEPDEETEHWTDECETTSLERSAARSAVWRPMMLVLVIGGIAYCVGRGHLAHVPGPLRPQHDSLWHAIQESPQPFVSDVRPDVPKRRLRFDPASRAVLLEEDVDGDGHFDRRRRFYESARP